MAECCILKPEKLLGATIRLDGFIRPDLELFGEDQARVVATTRPEHERQFIELCAAHQVPVKKIGVVGGSTLKINDWVEAECEEMSQHYHGAIGMRMGEEL